ncbi:hypothetical protein [Terrabacter sp. C0L_2]|uniref:hypothetical protein n=1 Tax=Terrabacter sp. C0L_2 TaxID=3108389 RepID=UPI002ED3242A|nr:hypothetical protein U5C87_05320 [Terrabacter sp. C0L_2]
MSTYAVGPGGAAEPAPLWAAALRRVSGTLARDLDVARAGRASDGALAEGLRAVGPGFDRLVARQGGAGPAVAQPVVDRWATHWARSVVALVGAGRFGEGSVSRWVLEWVVPALRLDLRTVTPLVIDDLVTAAAQVSGRADATDWARGIEAGLAAWPSGVPLTDDRVREVGAVSAWRAGHVRLRSAARALVPNLPEAVAGAVLRAEPGQDVPDLLARNAETPCAWGGPVVERPIGAFRGFGGAWLLPPVVTGGDGHRWSVVSGQTRWTVLTDAFGEAVLPDESEPDSDAAAPAPRQASWERYGDDVTGAVRAGGVVLVSRRSSHRLLLVADGGATP